MSKQIDTGFVNSSNNQALAQQIISIIQAIRFGSIEIVVHDGQVVQIDKHEKFRVKHTPANH